MRTIGYIFLGFTVLHGMGHLASADIFKCHIAGKIVFQNRPCASEKNSQPYITHPVPSGSSPAPVPPAQVLGSSTPSVAPMAPPPPERSLPPLAAVPASKAVDTRQLGLIRPGMTMYEVEKRLGKPESVYDRGWVRYRGQLLHQTDWVYPALQSQVPPALIRFAGDRVIMTDRIQ